VRVSGVRLPWAHYNRSMRPFPPLLVATAVFAALLGLFLALYARLTAEQRRTTREIRGAASGRGWRYRPLRWRGDLTAFRIDGQSRIGLVPWILISDYNRGYDRRWSVLLRLIVPSLGGGVDLAVLPRESADRESVLRGRAIPAGAETWVSRLSGAAASAVAFFRDAVEVSGGLETFDAAYQTLATPQTVHQRVVDPAIAGRILHWPEGAVAPHSVLAWRDPFGFQLQARLPGPPNLSTVLHVLELADEFIARVPPSPMPPAPAGLVDRLVARLLRL